MCLRNITSDRNHVSRWSRFIIGILMIVALGVCLERPTDAVEKKPNVVLIISDDQAWNDFGFMGHPTIKTPNLDKLARQSALFTRGYVPSSLCRPSLMTMITGLYPHQHKITGNDPPKGTDRNKMLRHIRSCKTLPKMLTERGYRSLQTGKWWEGNYRLGGFTHGMTHGDTTRGGRHGDLGLKIGRTGLKPIYDFIDQSGDKPFFVWYAPFLPHSPHNPPQKYLKKYRAQGKSIHVARYQAMCEWFDATCGELLNHLDQKGLAENTLVVFVTDNGWIQRPNSRSYAPRSKRSPYDGGIRTPIMLRWPGTIKPSKLAEPVISIDLAPTILAACGVKPDTRMQGINLLEVAAGKPSGRKSIFGEVFTHDEINLVRPATSLLYRWCVKDRWKLIAPAGGKQVELFDIVADPFEKKNVTAENARVVSRMISELDVWWNPRAIADRK